MPKLEKMKRMKKRLPKIPTITCDDIKDRFSWSGTVDGDKLLSLSIRREYSDAELDTFREAQANGYR